METGVLVGRAGGKGVHSLHRQTRTSVLSGFNTGSLGSMIMNEWKQMEVEVEVMVKGVSTLCTGRQGFQ